MLLCTLLSASFCCNSCQEAMRLNSNANFVALQGKASWNSRHKIHETSCAIHETSSYHWHPCIWLHEISPESVLGLYTLLPDLPGRFDSRVSFLMLSMAVFSAVVISNSSQGGRDLRDLILAWIQSGTGSRVFTWHGTHICQKLRWGLAFLNAWDPICKSCWLLPMPLHLRGNNLQESSCAISMCPEICCGTGNSCCSRPSTSFRSWWLDFFFLSMSCHESWVNSQGLRNACKNRCYNWIQIGCANMIEHDLCTNGFLTILKPRRWTSRTTFEALASRLNQKWHLVGLVRYVQWSRKG